MTKKEALHSIVSQHLINNLLIDKTLIDRSINGSEEYTLANKTEIEICKAYLYRNIALNPDFKQGSFSITEQQSKALLSQANAIFLENGLQTEVTNKTIIKIY